MEAESRVLSGREMLRWGVLALVLGLGIFAFFALGQNATPFHPIPSAVNVEGHR